MLALKIVGVFAYNMVRNRMKLKSLVHWDADLLPQFCAIWLIFLARESPTCFINRFMGLSRVCFSLFRIFVSMWVSFGL
jgi:hypothetical protein